MDILNHNGAVYVKASVLAKRHRYTTDYIGQLCRQNKVDAQLVGRAWYVNENSLLTHKIDRKKDTRSNEIISKNVVEIHTLSPEVINRVNVHSVTSKKTFRQFFTPELPAPVNHHWQNRAVAYVDDAATLVPLVTNKIRKNLVESVPAVSTSISVPVALAESEPVVVREVSEPHKHLEFTSLPEIPLAGDLPIQDMDTESDFRDSEPVTEVDLEPVIFATEPPVTVRRGVTLRYDRITRPVQQPVHKEKPPMSRMESPVRPAFERKVLKIPLASVSANASSVGTESHMRRGPVLLMPAMILMAVFLAIFLVSGSSTLRTDGTTVRETFSFRVSTLAGALIFFSQKP